MTSFDLQNHFLKEEESAGLLLFPFHRRNNWDSGGWATGQAAQLGGGEKEWEVWFILGSCHTSGKTPTHPLHLEASSPCWRLASIKGTMEFSAQSRMTSDPVSSRPGPPLAAFSPWRLRQGELTVWGAPGAGHRSECSPTEDIGLLRKGF